MRYVKRNSAIRRAIRITGLLLCGGVALPSCLDLSDDSPPDIHLEKELASPGSNNVATFYVISGGGAAGYVNMRLKLRSKSEPFKADKEYVFEMTGSYNLDLLWADNNRLVVTYPSDANVKRKLPSKGSINISYVPSRSMSRY